MRKRVALVTGSATGLGVQAVLELARAGFHIIINYRSSEEKALLLKNKVEALGVQSAVLQADISKREDCERLVEQALAHFGTVDICVLNAGPYIFERKKMAEYSVEEWELMVQGNLSSVFYITKALIPLMRANKWGRIITYGYQQAGQASGWGTRSAFAAAKAGLASLTRTLAEEESEHGITVNMICPGDIVHENKEKLISEVEAQTEYSAPIGRPGTGEDISRVVAFLCSEDSDFITGSIIEVNGGFNVFQKHK